MDEYPFIHVCRHFPHMIEGKEFLTILRGSGGVNWELGRSVVNGVFGIWGGRIGNGT